MTPEQRALWKDRLKVGGILGAIFVGVAAITRTAFRDPNTRAEDAARGPCGDVYDRLIEAGYSESDALHILAHPNAFRRIIRDVGASEAGCLAALRARNGEG